MAKTDRIRVQHMVDAAREAIAFARGRARADLDQDRMLNLAIVRLLEIIGEPARQVCPPTRQQYPSIPWQDIADMRNRLARGYADINLDVVWNVVERELPSLVEGLEQLLAGGISEQVGCAPGCLETSESRLGWTRPDGA